MKSISATLVIIILVIITNLSSCRKYEEGPWISLRSSIKRIYGVYKLTTYQVNGVDSLSSLYDSLGLTFQFYYDKMEHRNICLNDDFRKDGLHRVLIWVWELTDKSKTLKVTSSSCLTIVGPFGPKLKPEWVIIKLKNNDIHLKTIYNDKDYYIEFGPN